MPVELEDEELEDAELPADAMVPLLTFVDDELELLVADSAAVRSGETFA
jgi:hypothetical protein